MDAGRLVARAARRFAGRVALDGPQGSQTFAEVGARVAQLARGLLSLGLAPGDRVLDLQTNQNTYIETDLGISTAGLIRIALNYRLHPGDWARIADDCGARALVYDGRFAESTADLRSGLEHVVVIGDGPGTPYERLLAGRSADPLLLDLDPDALVSLNYSSGTTGRPKGAKRTHRNRFASLTNIVSDILGRTPTARDAWCHAGPITHTSGLFVLTYFAYGARQVILPSWDAEAFLDAVEHRGVTATALVPTMIARLLAHPECRPERTRGLGVLGYAGAPMPPGQIREALSRITPHMVQYYGLVEAIPPVTVLNAADHALGASERSELLASAGRPCIGVELRIVDEDGRGVPAGEVGEVITRGDHVMRGYWGASVTGDVPKAVRDGWLHTGDLGRLDADERLYLVDRKGDMIISGGYNIYPREVEDVIAEVPGVAEAAVIGVDDPEWGQRVVALYTVRKGIDVAPDRVLDHCRERLASYKKPKLVRQVESFPLSSTGKIAKTALRERIVAAESGGEPGRQSSGDSSRESSREESSREEAGG